MELSKENIITLLMAGCTDLQIAGRLGITPSELAFFEGLITQDDPDWPVRRLSLRHSQNAQAKINVNAAIFDPLSDSKTKLETSKWNLEKTDPEYNPKHYHVNIPPNAIMPPDERLALLSKFPEFIEAEFTTPTPNPHEDTDSQGT